MPKKLNLIKGYVPRGETIKEPEWFSSYIYAKVIRLAYVYKYSYRELG
jgi:hypothetical protein